MLLYLDKFYILSSRCHMCISNIKNFFFKNGIQLFCPLTQIHSHRIGETIVFICVTHILLKRWKIFQVYHRCNSPTGPEGVTAGRSPLKA